MIVLNTHLIAKANGLYAVQAEENLRDLKQIMKALVIKESPGKSEAIWAGEKSVALPATKGSKVWRRNYVTSGKKEKAVKTFAL